MKETITNSWQNVGSLMGRLTAQKKKIAVAVFLIFVMGFMWLKVLLKVPNSVAADVVDGTVRQSQSKLIYVPLPVVPKRNDTLIRDFFTIGDGFIKDKAVVNVVSSPENEELTRRIAAKLKLEAIVLGESPQAFINDVLVSQGDKFVVEEADRKYEFVVVKIGQDTVFIRCQSAEITLKLAPAVE
jgi:putative NIF3 family GTP cyclohydrolase 1 type 2